MTDFLNISPLPSYVDGKPFPGKGSYTVLDPHDTSKEIQQVSSVTVDDIPAVIEAAKKALPAWKAVSGFQVFSLFSSICQLFFIPFSTILCSALFSRGLHLTHFADFQTSVIERRNIFLKAAALLRERIPQYIGVEHGETTSSEGWSGFDLTCAADQ